MGVEGAIAFVEETPQIPFRQIVETVSDGIWLLGFDGRTTYVNRQMSEMLGYELAALIGKPLFDFLSNPSKLEANSYSPLSRLGSGERFNTQLKRSDGSELWVSMSLTPTLDDKGEITGGLVTCTDITDRHAAHLEHERLSAIADLSDDAIFSENLDCTILTWNGGAERMFNYTAAEAVGRPITMLLPENRLREELTIIEKIKRGERIRQFETVRRTRDGHDLNVSVSVSPIRDASGKIVGATNLIRDISEQVEARNAVPELDDSIQKQLMELRTLLDVVPIGIGFVRDRRKREIEINRPLALLLGLPEDTRLLERDTLRQNGVSVWRNDSRLTQDQLPIQLSILNNQTVSELDLEVRRKDQTSVHIMESSAPLRDDNGVATGAVAAFVDVTSNRHENDTAQSHQVDVERLSRFDAMGKFGAGMAHELNQPLGAILNYAAGALELIRRDNASSPAMQSALIGVTESAHRMGEIIKRLRTFVHKGAIDRGPQNAAALAENAVRRMGTELHDKGIAVETHLAPALPRVHADAVQVEQVLVNLIRNAADAMASTGAIGRTLALITSQADGHVRIDVCDQGCGVPADQLDRIFEPFVTTKRDGMGMGLAISRSIAEDTGGQLVAALNPAGGMDLQPDPPGFCWNAKMNDNSMVYVVDDDPAVRASLQFMFKSADLNCAAFESTAAFVDASKPDVPSCLVLDVRLNGECGLDFVQQWKTGAISGMPIIIMTGSADVPLAVRSMKLGVLDFLEKPTDPKELVAAAREALVVHSTSLAQEVRKTDIRTRLKDLTPRERELLKLICGGLSNKQIAAELQISIKTVANHRAHLLAKAKAANTADMVRLAVLGDAF